MTIKRKSGIELTDIPKESNLFRKNKKDTNCLVDPPGVSYWQISSRLPDLAKLCILPNIFPQTVIFHTDIPRYPPYR